MMRPDRLEAAAAAVLATQLNALCSTAGERIWVADTARAAQ